MAQFFEFIGASKGGLLMDTGALTTNDIGKLMAVSHQGPLANTRLSGRTILILIGVAVILHVGQEIFVPLALPLLLTFTLAPIVSFLRKHSVPRLPPLFWRPPQPSWQLRCSVSSSPRR
ncbi:hypothetical protein AGR4B_pAt20166 [Agrobacterium tumefaciens str. CFBP 5621]|uniref:hypothetical protein n=1 Tax=Agrobacterium tumefaciens TaxID=358 RepID=UPI0009CA6AFC|nr:hypothetical protein [Agrobacterium tumefaciens]CUX53620.1 hypothetical protein AGR4B_pAt20166 [Agrobacterium tumefaciens str. CFBP 5621]